MNQQGHNNLLRPHPYLPRSPSMSYQQSFSGNPTPSTPIQNMHIQRIAMIEQMNEMGTRSFGDLIEMVRQGYRTAAIPYNQQKDTTVLQLPIFNHFLGLIPPEGFVAELGCGSGFPVAQHIATSWQGTNRRYIGIDLSEEQIDIAKQLLKDNEICTFTVREMMDWCRKQRDNSVSGIIALFSIFHLPRNQHVDLLTQIFRILKDSSPVLFTTCAKPTEGTDVGWLGSEKMFWSSFSVNWYEVTLADLGFEFVSKSKENRDFVSGVKDDTYFLLYRKPITPFSGFPSTPQSPGLMLGEMMLGQDITF